MSRYAVFFFHAETRSTRRTSLKAIYLANDSVFEADHVEVDQQAHVLSPEPEVQHNLRLMNLRDLRVSA